MITHRASLDVPEETLATVCHWLTRHRNRAGARPAQGAATTKLAVPGASGRADLWWSGKHDHHGGNIQVLTDHDRYPQWVSPVEPVSTNDITAARAHVLPFLYPAATAGLPTLTDKGYQGAGIGILAPFKGTNLNTDAVTRNTMINALHAPAERANALLKATWPVLRRSSIDPWHITETIAAALVLLHLQRPAKRTR